MSSETEAILGGDFLCPDCGERHGTALNSCNKEVQRMKIEDKKSKDSIKQEMKDKIIIISHSRHYAKKWAERNGLNFEEECVYVDRTEQLIGWDECKVIVRVGDFYKYTLYQNEKFSYVRRLLEEKIQVQKGREFEHY